MPEDAGSIYSAVILKLDQLQQGVVRVESLMNQVVNSSKKKASSFGNFWQNAFQTAFGFGIVQLINKVTSSLRDGLRVFSGYQQSIRNTQSVTGALGEELRLIEQAAKDAGETTRFTAKEAADALYFLGSAGFSAQQSIAALDGVLQLAGATQSDLASTSESVASIISQFGLNASEAGRVSNVFAAAIGNSQATMEKLSNSFRQVGPVAAGFGYTLEETTGVLQQLYNAGFQGQQAGRALKSALADLASPTSNMEKIFSKLNISLDKVNPTTNEFSDIIDTLAQSGATTADIIDAFGKVAGPQMAVLISQGGDALRDYTDAVTGTNAAAEAYAIQNDSLAGSLDFLQSKLESTAIAIFEKLEPGMRDLIDSFIKFLDATRPIGEALGFLLNIFLQIASISTKGITFLFDNLLKSFRGLKTPMEEATENFNSVREAIQKTGEIQSTVNRLSSLTDEYERLSSKTELTEKEQDQLKKVIAEIEKIAPDATTKMDKYGNAIEISGEKSREAARQMLESRKAIIEQSKASLEATKPALESLLEVQGEQLRYLKEEEQRTARINRVTKGRFSVLNEMRNVFTKLQEEEVKYGNISTGSFSRSTEGVLRYVARLRELGLTQFDVFAKGGGTVVGVLEEIEKSLNETEKDYKNYQDLLSQRIEVEIEVIDIRKKLDELANLETELKNIDEGIKILDESTGEATGKAGEYADKSSDFWSSFREEIEKATREASFFGEKSDVLKATLDFLRKAYLDLIDEGMDPAGETLTRIRKEYDLTLLELNNLIESEKKHAEELEKKADTNKKLAELTQDYRNKLEELNTPEEKLIELERQRAKEAILATEGTKEAITEALGAVDEYYNKLQETSKETKESFQIDIESMLSTAMSLASALSELFRSIADSRIEELDRQMEAELERLGLLEETERERLERELQEAIESGDEITAQEKQNALDRLDIEEEYERKKAQIQYEAELAAWKFKLAAAIADMALGIAKAISSAPWPFNLPAIGFATALGGIQVASVTQQEPSPPAFDTGGVYTGPATPGVANAELHPNEMILNQDQQKQLFDLVSSKNGGGATGNQRIAFTFNLFLDKYQVAKMVEDVANAGQITFTARALRK